MKKERNAGTKTPYRFVTALSIVSIFSFLGIVSRAFFDFDAEFYVESLLIGIVGIGLILEARAKKLKSIAHGLTQNNFTHLTTVIIGAIALIAGIFSFPPIRIQFAGFLAIKGIISIIAIVVIAIQTWILD